MKRRAGALTFLCVGFCDKSGFFLKNITFLEGIWGLGFNYGDLTLKGSKWGVALT